jgi:hypothetical protein
MRLIARTTNASKLIDRQLGKALNTQKEYKEFNAFISRGSPKLRALASIEQLSLERKSSTADTNTNGKMTLR